MTFDDLKEYLGAEWDRTRGKLEENPLVQRLQESYQNLSILAQRSIWIVTLVMILGVLFSIPFGYFSSSADTLVTFESHRESLQDFYKTERESSFLNELPDSTTPEAIEASVQSQLQSMSILPEQITPPQARPAATTLLPQAIVQSEIIIQLKALNVKQITDVGAQIQSIHPLIRMKDLSIQNSVDHPRYFDVAYTLLLLKGKSL